MIIIDDEDEFDIEGPCALAIGKFDGIHTGHKTLLDKILEKKKSGMKATVFTFEPSPASFLGLSDGRNLMTKEEKRSIFKRMGVDYLIEFPMNARTAAIRPVNFVKDYLVDRINAKYIVCGDDLSFGDKGRGNFVLLDYLSYDFEYECEQISKVCYEGKVISSSYIRSSIENGDMTKAINMLGNGYIISGIVEHGNHLGSTLGMPTINIPIPSSKVIPKKGVYYSNIFINGNSYIGITNVGEKPTVSDKHFVGTETYIYDFDKDVYGEPAKIELLHFVREEQRFESVERLAEAISHDVNAGREYFGIKCTKNVK